jgi:hypothetical protein
MEINEIALTRARESRAAIERLYIEMRHLFNSGACRSLGSPGEVITEALRTLSPEIYGSMTDPHKVELEGLVYVMDRLPKGIEECRYIKLVSEEGYKDSDFEVVLPVARRRNCYRIDKEYMLMEVTRGRSEIYDILTHLTFLFSEADKIRHHILDKRGEPTGEWKRLEAVVSGSGLDERNREVAFSFLSSILGRSFAETKHAYERLARNSDKNNGLFHIVYWLGRLSLEEELQGRYREVTFSPTLRDRIGHHIYGERWAVHIKQHLHRNRLLERPLHIISANTHSVMNALFAYPALRESFGPGVTIEQLAMELSQPENQGLRKQVAAYAQEHGMDVLDDPYGTGIAVQIFDTERLDLSQLAPELHANLEAVRTHRPVILTMDYAFGEQAFETMDELLKPFKGPDRIWHMPVVSVSVMGKAGILEGGKGDIMVPNSHVFEGTADNYPFENDFSREHFLDSGETVLEGPMITVLGTSLQNRDVLEYFKNSSWQAIGLEMEGAHYQKAIQAAARIRKNIRRDVVLRYAYYASDNPLLSGSTLASGSLGLVGVKPTYLITRKILERILQAPGM